MKFTPEPTISHERSSGNHKPINHEGTSFHRVIPMGDCPSNTASNCYARSSDSVSCWGDAPKRPARFIGLLEEGDREVTSIASHKATRHTADQRFPSSPQRTGNVDRTRHTEQSSDSNAKDKGTNKADGTTGRERLLEWLRTSQAKRDENNRQVFTRWIDKVESMNNQALNTANFNQTTIPLIDTANSTDYTSASLYPFAPHPLSSPITAPALWLGNPMGFMATTAAQATGSAFKVPGVVSTNLSNAYPPFSPKTPFGGPLFTQNPSNPSFITPVAPTALNADVSGNHSLGTQLVHDNLHSDILSPNSLTSQHVTHHCDDEMKLCSDDATTTLTCDPVKLAETINDDPSAQSAFKNNVFNPCLNAPTFATDPALLRGGCYAQPVYITSTVGDSSCGQVLCYCYVPGTGQPAFTYAVHSPTLAKIPGLNQPMIYLVHQNGAYSTYYAADGSMLGPSVQLRSEQMASHENSTLRQADYPSNQTNESYTSSMNHSDELSGTKACFATTETPINLKQATQEETINLSGYNKPQTTIDFDFQKWYSILNEITQASVVTK